MLSLALTIPGKLLCNPFTYVATEKSRRQRPQKAVSPALIVNALPTQPILDPEGIDSMAFV